MSQGSGTAGGIGCRILCFCQAKPCPVWEGVGRQGRSGVRDHRPCSVYLLGRATSASEPRATPCLRRMKAVKGFSRNSTSPTATWAASAPGGTFFLNRFLS